MNSYVRKHMLAFFALFADRNDLDVIWKKKDNINRTKKVTANHLKLLYTNVNRDVINWA